jgi:hypothetical protein
MVLHHHEGFAEAYVAYLLNDVDDAAGFLAAEAMPDAVVLMTRHVHDVGGSLAVVAVVSDHALEPQVAETVLAKKYP